MRFSFILIAASVLAFATVHTGFAMQDPDAVGTKIVTVQAGAFPGAGAIVSGNVAMAGVGSGHLYGGLQLGADYSKGSTGSRVDLTLTPRLLYGFNLGRVVEFHLGGLAGIAVRHITENRLQFAYGGFAGFRFALTPSLGLLAEGCYSPQLPYATAGLAFKF